jgi:small subunit ribosomal protein S6
MVVFRPDIQEAGTKEQIERIRKLLEANGATVGAAHEWGLRELAYEIEKERRGYYVLFEYTGAAAAVAELERTLKLSDAVLRFVSVRQEGDASVAVPPRDEEASLKTMGELEDDDEEALGGDAEAADVE